MLGKKDQPPLDESIVERLRMDARSGARPQPPSLQSEQEEDEGGGAGPGSRGRVTSHAASASPEIQERALSQMVAMLKRLGRGLDLDLSDEEALVTTAEGMAELQTTLRQVCQRLEIALVQQRLQVERLSEQLSRLSRIADRLEGERAAGPAAASRPERYEDETFQPVGPPLRVVVRHMPGFQRLMEVQRALSDLPQVEGASALSYENDEALLDVLLVEQVTVSQIAGALRDAIGRDVVVEEVEPEPMQLRLRFVEGNGHARGGGMRPDLWPRA